MQNIFNRIPVQKTPDFLVKEDYNIEEPFFDFHSDLLSEQFIIEQNLVESAYIALKDGNREIITEGMKDTKTKIINFFKKMYDKLKEMFSRTIMFFTAYIGNFQKFLSKNATLLSKLNPDFSIQGYEYSFDTNVPDLTLLDDLIAEYNSNITKLNATSLQDVKAITEKDNDKEYYEKCMGKVLGQNQLGDEEYEKEIARSFRSGAESETTIQVNQTYLNNIVSNFPGLVKECKEMQNTHNKILLTLQTLINYFNKMPIVHRDGNEKYMNTNTIKRSDNQSGIDKTDTLKSDADDKDMSLKITIYYKYFWSRANKLMPIATKATSGKLSALKENLKFVKKVVRKSITAKKQGDGAE